MKLSILLASLVGVAAAAEPALQQASMNGMLVQELPNGSLAGCATLMNATDVSKQGGFEIGFNQDVGELMKKSLDEVSKFIKVRHHGKLPDNHRIELAFADKYSPKDGPSAAVACALLIDATLTGDALDPKTAVTGDLTAQGEVRPVGGVSAKLSGALKKRCQSVMIPIANVAAVDDIYVRDGIKPLYQMQIFSIADFTQAKTIAMQKRAPEVQQAMDDFAAVQQALGRDENFVFNPKLQEKLRGVLKTVPHHLSAKLLLLHGLKQGPKRLSLAGSLVAISIADQSFVAMLKDESWTAAGGNDDVLLGFINDLERLRLVVDKRTVDYGDAYHRLAVYIKSIRGRRQFTPEIRSEIQSSINRIDSQRRNLFSDPEVREELMLD